MIMGCEWCSCNQHLHSRRCIADAIWAFLGARNSGWRRYAGSWAPAQSHPPGRFRSGAWSVFFLLHELDVLASQTPLVALIDPLGQSPNAPLVRALGVRLFSGHGQSRPDGITYEHWFYESKSIVSVAEGDRVDP